MKLLTLSILHLSVSSGVAGLLPRLHHQPTLTSLQHEDRPFSQQWKRNWKSSKFYLWEHLVNRGLRKPSKNLMVRLTIRVDPPPPMVRGVVIFSVDIFWLILLFYDWAKIFTFAYGQPDHKIPIFLWLPLRCSWRRVSVYVENFKLNFASYLIVPVTILSLTEALLEKYLWISWSVAFAVVWLLRLTVKLPNHRLCDDFMPLQ